ncbi:unnamed protein product [Dimorphilus gyrociliatus]|uniref:Uncharacterized protein n=1 Tax=Dimorphilus gyrociliatus TaxID=2664684 RepID=A0A7I8W053_9ANNE|nr:unnamed protein product [Dimorphilus gyrociliatus]
MSSSDSNLKRTTSAPVEIDEKRSMKEPIKYSQFSYDSRDRNVKFNNVPERRFKPKLQRMPTPYVKDDIQEENTKRLVRQQNVKTSIRKLSEIWDENKEGNN